MLPRPNRLRDFNKCFSSAHIKLRSRHCLLLVHAADDSTTKPELGIVVAKRRVARAHLRNAIKRRARAIFFERLKLEQLQGCACVLLVTSKGIAAADSRQIFSELQKLFGQLSGALAARHLRPAADANPCLSATAQPAARQ